MANYELVALVEGTPQLRAPTASDVATTAGTMYPALGIQLGGAASANLLDDYEEGAWTPTFVTSGGSFTYGSQIGSYTKIGRQVFCRCYIFTTAATVGTGAVVIGGLPFTVSGSAEVRGGGGIGASTLFAGDNPSSYGIIEGSSVLRPYYRTAANGETVSLDASDLGTGTSNEISVEFSYFVA